MGRSEWVRRFIEELFGRARLRMNSKQLTESRYVNRLLRFFFFFFLFFYSFSWRFSRFELFISHLFQSFASSSSSLANANAFQHIGPGHNKKEHIAYWHGNQKDERAPTHVIWLMFIFFKFNFSFVVWLNRF